MNLEIGKREMLLRPKWTRSRHKHLIGTDYVVVYLYFNPKTETEFQYAYADFPYSSSLTMKLV